MPTLILMQFPSDTAFALASLQEVFFESARAVEGNVSSVHIGYNGLAETPPAYLPEGFKRLLDFDLTSTTPAQGAMIEEYVRTHEITRALAFDMNVGARSIPYLRRGGIEWMVSYWGAPMSALNSGLKLALKRLEVRLRRGAPNHYVFESEAMRETAIYGRGVPHERTSVIRLGVDTERFHPGRGDRTRFRELGIPDDRLVVMYSGHVGDPRKGVAVIMDAARHLVETLGDTRLHFLLCGNREGEKEQYQVRVDGTAAAGHVTFAGYRSDVPELLRAADVGIIASTGWDSFTMSATEMAASGLPMVVSDLQGLKEAVVEGETGFIVPTGDPVALAGALARLADDGELRARMGDATRKRALTEFSLARQIERISEVLAGRVQRDA